VSPTAKLRASFAALGLAVWLAGAANAQAVQGLDGRWEGPLELGNGMKLTGVFRVETKDGKTTAVFDSPEQGARDMPATLKRDGAKVSFDVPSAMIGYTATLSADGKTLTGDMSQGGGSIPVTMTHKSASAAAVASTSAGPLVAGLDGRWEGAIETPAGPLTGVFRISSDAKGTTTLMDSPDQNVAGIPATVKRDGAKVVIEVPGVGGGFTGDLSSDGKTIVGAWSQLGGSMPLTVTKK
jgi:hypothetical protein